MSDPRLIAFVRESNRIEGITRAPRAAEIEAHERLLDLPEIQVRDLEAFVSACQPGAVLRRLEGMNVLVGNHRPPPGGPGIVKELEWILDAACVRKDPYLIHHAYETLHPFMDGNGRSGRALWAWQMTSAVGMSGLRLGFLHAWYYQSLQHGAGRG